MEINRESIEQMISQILAEKLGQENNNNAQGNRENTGNIIKVGVPKIQVSERDRLDTGHSGDQVFTHDLFSLSESPRLGCGIMEMERTTFDWTLNYDEVDYVIEGALTVIKDGKSVTAGPGEIILIPKGSKIQFSVPQSARFIYVTYPADWADQT